MNIEVIALVAQNGGAETSVSIELSDGIHTELQKHTILTKQYAALRIKKGEINTERYEEIARAADICTAYKKGLSLLSYSSSSQKNLHYKLKSRGFSDEIASEAIEMLISERYVDEESSCTREAQRCIQKLWGKKRIVSHLYTKGFDQKAVANALDELQNVDYVENCKRLLLRDHKRQIKAIKEDSSQLSKLIASLYRMGYSFSEIKSAVADILNE